MPVKYNFPPRQVNNASSRKHHRKRNRSKNELYSAHPMASLLTLIELKQLIKEHSDQAMDVTGPIFICCVDHPLEGRKTAAPRGAAALQGSPGRASRAWPPITPRQSQASDEDQIAIWSSLSGHHPLFGADSEEEKVHGGSAHTHISPYMHPSPCTDKQETNKENEDLERKIRVQVLMPLIFVTIKHIVLQNDK